MKERTIAIGDIHGCSDALVALIEALDPRPADTIVTLGDYIDHGPNSKGVIAELIALAKRCRLIPLLGNHEEMLLDARTSNPDTWLRSGGAATITSYGIPDDLKGIPPEHLAFLEGLRRYHETDTHLFVHANYAPNLPLDKTDWLTTLWLSLDQLPGPHYSGKIAVLGHTPQPDHAVLDAGHLFCIDTGCGYGGLLTALDVDSGEIWQVDG